MVFEGEELSKGFLSTDFVSLFSIFLLSKILVVRPRVIGVENKVLSPMSSYQSWSFEPDTTHRPKKNQENASFGFREV